MRIWTERLRISAPRLAQLVNVSGKQLAEAAEAVIPGKTRADVAERPGDVLDVGRSAPRRGLEAKRPERLQVALQRHEVKPTSEIARICVW